VSERKTGWQESEKKGAVEGPCSHLGVTCHVTPRKNDLEKKKVHCVDGVVGAGQTQKRVRRAHDTECVVVVGKTHVQFDP